MADEQTSGVPDPAEIPVSQFADSFHRLVSAQALAAPTRPGVAGKIGRYEILRVLGRGGMGVVLLARAPGSVTLVALKTLRPELVPQPEAVRRFLAEARHMQQLQHPGIMPVLDIGEQDRVPWFAMPYCERGSLAAALVGGRPLDRARILSIAQAVAGALDYAHRRGIIHRDLKPANILLTADGGVRVADFGLARTVFNDSITEPDRGPVEGTAPYMSPAVARGEAEDTRCDIYSFGAVLYEMLTGRPPYQGPDPAAIRAQIRAGPPRAIHSLSPKADPRLTQVAEDAIARELRDRYAHMADVVADLERIARGRAPLGAKAIRLGPALRRAGFSRWTGAVAATLVLLASGVWAWTAGRPRIVLERRLTHPQVMHWASAMTANWDGDEVADFVVPTPDGLRVISGRGQLLNGGFQLNEPHTSPGFSAHWVADADGDGYDEVFTCWADGGTAVLAPLNLTGFPLKRFTAPSTTFVHPQWGPDWTRLRAQALTDLDGDGCRELLVATGTHRGREPRALICYDYESQTQRWYQTLAPAIARVLAADIDGDGRKEVLCGTHAVYNGNALPDGTDDGHSYVFAFSAEGKLLWRVEGGGVFSMALPVVAENAKGGTDLYVQSFAQGYLTEHGEREFGRIVRLDHRGTETARWENPRTVLDCLAADLDGNGEAELLATDVAGRVIQLDRELKPVRQTSFLPERFNGVYVFLAGVTNLTGIAGRQLVAVGWQFELLRPVLGNKREEVTTSFRHQVKLVVLDASLRRVAEYLVAPRLSNSGPSPARLCDLDGDGVSEMVFLDDDLRVFKLQRGF